MGNLRRGSSLCRQVSWSPEREAVVVRRPRPHLAVVARSPYVRGSSSSKRHIQRDDAPRHEGKQSSQTGFTDMVIMSSVHLIQKRLVCLPIWIPLNGEATCFSRLLWRDWRLSLFDLISQNLLLRLLFNFPFKKTRKSFPGRTLSDPPCAREKIWMRVDFGHRYWQLRLLDQCLCQKYPVERFSQPLNVESPWTPVQYGPRLLSCVNTATTKEIGPIMHLGS